MHELSNGWNCLPCNCRAQVINTQRCPTGCFANKFIHSASCQSWSSKHTLTSGVDLYKLKRSCHWHRGSGGRTVDRGQAGSLQEGLLGKGIEACRSPVAGPARVQGVCECVLNFKEVRFFSLDERKRTPFLRWKFTCCTLHHVRRCASAPGIVSNSHHTCL